MAGHTRFDTRNIYPHRKLCCQAGFLPVPLNCVPYESLSELDLYLNNGTDYVLYRNIGIQFGLKDYQRLLESGIESVYVSVREHQQYHQALERSLEAIVADPEIQQEKKAEILYSTSLEIANQIILEPPAKREIDRTESLVHSTVKMIIQNDTAFGQLFSVSNHDYYTATHMVNVCSSVVYLGWKMGLLQEDFLQKIGVGAMLHDVGKMFISAELLNTEEKFTEDEYKQIQSHVQLGCEHLARVASLPPESMMVVAEHHERMDGSGYPLGLQGGEISLAGRLAAVVDTFEAMTSVRPYRKHTFSVEDALEYLEYGAPRKYDQEIVTVFKGLMLETLDLKGGRTNYDSHKEFLGKITDDKRAKRGATRYYFRIPAYIRTIKRVEEELKLGPAKSIIIHNMSSSGLGLLSCRPMKPDQNICITIPILGKPIHLIALVVRCYDHGDGWYTVGAKFHTPVEKNLIQNLRNQKVN